MNGERGATIPLLPILSVTFLGALGFSLVLPFLVFLVTRWGGNAIVYGAIGAIYSACQLVAAPILGRWSDRVGRRRILLISQLGTAIAWTIFAVAFLLPLAPSWEVDSAWLGAFALTPPLVVLFLARAADGLTGGDVSVANAYLADLTSASERPAAFGKMAVASNLGFIGGPAIAGLLAATPLRELLPVLAALSLSLVASALIAWRLPDSSCRELEEDPEGATLRKAFGQEPRHCFEMEGEKELGVRQILALPGVGSLLALYFLIMLAFNLFYVAFPVYAAQGLGWSIFQVGIFFSILGLMMAVVQGPLLSRLARRFRPFWLMTSGSIALAAAFACFASDLTSVLYLGVALMAVGNGLLWPSLLAHLADQAGERVQGAVQGLAGSLGAVAAIVGLLAGGLLYAALEGLVFGLAALLAVIVGIVCARRIWSEGVTP